MKISLKHPFLAILCLIVLATLSYFGAFAVAEGGRNSVFQILKYIFQILCFPSFYLVGTSVIEKCPVIGMLGLLLFNILVYAFLLVGLYSWIRSIRHR